jgi:hypothetical protein
MKWVIQMATPAKQEFHGEWMSGDKQVNILSLSHTRPPSLPGATSLILSSRSLIPFLLSLAVRARSLPRFFDLCQHAGTLNGMRAGGGLAGAVVCSCVHLCISSKELHCRKPRRRGYNILGTSIREHIYSASDIQRRMCGVNLTAHSPATETMMNYPRCSTDMMLTKMAFSNEIKSNR